MYNNITVCITIENLVSCKHITLALLFHWIISLQPSLWAVSPLSGTCDSCGIRRYIKIYIDVFAYIPYLALTCQHYFTPICKSQCPVMLTLSLHLSLSSFASATASNRQQLRHCLLFCAFFCSFFCGLVTWAFVCRHLLPTLFRYHLCWQHPLSPALFASIVLLCSANWCGDCVLGSCGDAGLSAMWGLPCRTCILIFIEQIEQPNEILIVCHVCVGLWLISSVSHNVWQFITVCAV